MKTVICGSRTIKNYQHVLDAVAASGFKITEVVSGCARGVDQLGERYAAERGLPVTKCPADWKGLGRIAGPTRNVEMAETSEAVIAIWDGKSPGTQHMISYSVLLGLKVFIKRVEGNE